MKLPARNHGSLGTSADESSSLFVPMRAIALPATMARLALMPAPAFANANVPDLTKGEKPVLTKKMKKPLGGNLGPTGLIGWVNHHRMDNSLNRQILVAEVAKGSPADWFFEEGGLNLGARGTSNPPGNFTAAARTPHFPALRYDPKAVAEACCRKQSPVSMIFLLTHRPRCGRRFEKRMIRAI